MSERIPRREYHIRIQQADGKDNSWTVTGADKAAKVLRAQTTYMLRDVACSLTDQEIEALEARAQPPVIGFHPRRIHAPQ